MATNRCLNVLRSVSRQPLMEGPIFDLDLPDPTRMGEVFWIEPYPDALLESAVESVQSPEARYEAREAISLAFVTALQLLPPRQRAVLVLRDVLGFSSRDVGEMLETTEESVSSALKRARATVRREVPSEDREPPAPNSPAEKELVARLTRAWESGDVSGIVNLLTDDAWVRMPPVPLEYQGRDVARRFFSVAFRENRRFRLVPTRANRQPAFGMYIVDPITQIPHANGLLVATLAGDRISALTRFDNSVLSSFGLPRSLAV
jgi:RNA polymerase sigma-70 factor (TIGR02960 family)